MAPDSLLAQARHACETNHRQLYDIGSCPYELIRSALLKIESPEQLYEVELNSSHIIGKDAELWLNFVKRDIPDWVKRREPRNPKNWFRAYNKMKEDAQKELDDGAEQLKAAFASIQQAKDDNVAVLKSRNQLPKQTKTELQQGLFHGPLKGVSGSSRVAVSKLAGKPTFLEKLKKEARGAGNTKMATATKDLKSRASTVTKAPQGFVEDVRRESAIGPATSTKKPLIRVPAPPLALQRRDPTVTGKLFKEGEDRLRALTSGNKALPATNEIPTNKSIVDRPEIRSKAPIITSLPGETMVKLKKKRMPSWEQDDLLDELTSGGWSQSRPKGERPVDAPEARSRAGTGDGESVEAMEERPAKRVRLSAAEQDRQIQGVTQPGPFSTYPISTLGGLAELHQPSANRAKQSVSSEVAATRQTASESSASRSLGIGEALERVLLKRLSPTPLPPSQKRKETPSIFHETKRRKRDVAGEVDALF